MVRVGSASAARTRWGTGRESRQPELRLAVLFARLPFCPVFGPPVSEAAASASEISPGGGVVGVALAAPRLGFTGLAPGLGASALFTSRAGAGGGVAGLRPNRVAGLAGCCLPDWPAPA